MSDLPDELFVPSKPASQPTPADSFVDPTKPLPPLLPGVEPLDPTPAPPPVVTAPPGPEARSRVSLLTVLAIAVALSLLLAWGCIWLIQSTKNPIVSTSTAPSMPATESGASSSATPSAAPSTTASPQPSATRTPWGGAVAPAAVTQLAATCQDVPSTDDAGNPVTYEPAKMTDGDPNTGWRCAGAGTGTVLTFTFPAGTKLAEVGLVNGYAKVDKASGGKRYPEYRRITAVRWSLADGSTVEQKLTDGEQGLQKMRVPVVEGKAPVTLTVLSSTAPGLAANRDAILISEVSFAKAA